MDATPEAVRTIARCHASGGTTAFVGSTVTTSWKRMMAVVDVAEEMTGQDTGGAELVGFHIEGPFLAPDQIRAHDPELRRDPQDVPYEELLERGSGVKRITVAPELPGLWNSSRPRPGGAGTSPWATATPWEIRFSRLWGRVVGT